MSGFNITDFITVVTSVLACLFGFLSWLNQVRTRLIVTPKSVVLNNNAYFKFKSLENWDIVISNLGYKSVTIVDVNLVIGQEKISLTQLNEDIKSINILICAGEVKTVSCNVNAIIEYISYKEFSKELLIYWEAVTSRNKHYKGKTGKKIYDVVNVNGAN